jgi:hypothetical protein
MLIILKVLLWYAISGSLVALISAIPGVVEFPATAPKPSPLTYALVAVLWPFTAVSWLANTWRKDPKEGWND